MDQMDQKYIDLYDDYTHGTMPRRTFLERLAKIAGGAAVAASILPILENNYSVSASAVPDDHVTSKRIEYKGESGKMEGLIAMPKKSNGKIPAVLVIHENKGLNPHIEDVAKRAAAAGFLALAPDGLSSLGGTPKDRDQARNLIRKLDRETTVKDFVAGVEFLKGHKQSNGNVGCVGFCWGGYMANQLAVRSANMKAAVAFYGRQAAVDDVPKIKGALMLHYAGNDKRINSGIEVYEKALREHKINYKLYMYEGVNHAFHNDSNAARYDKEAAKLAWQRTVKFWKEYL